MLWSGQKIQWQKIRMEQDAPDVSIVTGVESICKELFV